MSDSHQNPNDLARDDLGLQRGDVAPKPSLGPPIAGAAAPKGFGGAEAVPANCGSDSKPNVVQPDDQSAIDACYLKAKSCYNDATDPALCDALMKKCAELSRPGTDGLPPTAAEPDGWAVESCWLKYKECYEYENDPALCESVGESCKKLESADLQ
jgi:hypothetical protein